MTYEIIGPWEGQNFIEKNLCCSCCYWVWLINCCVRVLPAGKLHPSNLSLDKKIQPTFWQAAEFIIPRSSVAFQYFEAPYGSKAYSCQSLPNKGMAFLPREQQKKPQKVMVHRVFPCNKWQVLATVDNTPWNIRSCFTIQVNIVTTSLFLIESKCILYLVLISPSLFLMIHRHF